MPPFMLLNIRLWLKQRLASLAHHFLSHPQWDFATSCMSTDMPAPCLSPVLANSHISGQSMLFIIHCWLGLQWCKGFKCTGNRHTQTSTHRRAHTDAAYELNPCETLTGSENNGVQSELNMSKLEREKGRRKRETQIAQRKADRRGRQRRRPDQSRSEQWQLGQSWIKEARVPDGWGSLH